MNEREILMDVFKDGGYNNIALRKALNAHPEMTNVQKAFVTEIVNGTLRNLIRIDYIVNQFSKTPVNKMKNKPSKKYKDSLYIGVPKENWIINEITNIA